VSNNARNATHNTTLVMTTPLYAFDKRKEAFRTKQERLFTAMPPCAGTMGIVAGEPKADWKPSHSAPSLKLAHGRRGIWPSTAYSRTSPSSRRRSSA
jgi:hypothetical protein